VTAAPVTTPAVTTPPLTTPPVSSPPTTSANTVPVQGGHLPIGSTQTQTFSQCVVTWPVTLPTGGTTTGSYVGDCSTAAAIASQYPGAVTSTTETTSTSQAT
jgi:hypothetical protein